MIYILFNILKYCNNLYKIKNLREFEELLKLKDISYCKNKLSRGIIIYYENKICIEKVLSYTSNVIKTNTKYITYPKEYLIISLPFSFSYFYVIVNIILYTLALSFITINNYISIFILLMTLFIKNYLFIIHTFLFLVVILNFIIYHNYLLIFSIIILIIAIKYNNVIYSSILFMIFNTHVINIYIVYTYIFMLVCYLYVSKVNEYKSRLKFSKLIVKESLKNIEVVDVDGYKFHTNGYYFFTINSESVIKINEINFKFISLELLFDKIVIVYVKNRNSFFTNRRKYSKIKECNKIYIYLYEVE